MANPFVHVELNTTDPGKARAFHTALFDWTLQDMPMPQGTYTTIDVGGGAGGTGTGGGMMQQIPHRPDRRDIRSLEPKE
ncbi:MAG: hypothetical protein ACMG5Z_03440 [Luteimonas sp.]